MAGKGRITIRCCLRRAGPDVSPRAGLRASSRSFVSDPDFFLFAVALMRAFPSAARAARRARVAVTAAVTCVVFVWRRDGAAVVALASYHLIQEAIEGPRSSHISTTSGGYWERRGDEPRRHGQSLAITESQVQFHGGGEKFFVDLLPDGWPGLPARTAARRSRRSRAESRAKRQ